MNRAERRAAGCKGGKHVEKYVPREGGGTVAICAVCEKLLEDD